MRMTYRDAARERPARGARRPTSASLLMGEDVGRYGGAFAVSKGLLEEFGPERIRDTPLVESAFVGAGIGAALGGLRPIVEIMTVNFSLLALDQVVNNAAADPAHVRRPVRRAAGRAHGHRRRRQLAAQHSHSLEGWYAHVPGIKVLTPGYRRTTPRHAAGGARRPDPVFIFEHAAHYPVEGEVDEDAGPADLWRARVRAPGRRRDADRLRRLASTGRSRPPTLLAAEGIEAEVLDLRACGRSTSTASSRSVRRTRRAVVVDEGWQTGSFAAEVAARIVERASTSSPPRSPGSAAPRCRSRTRPISRRRRCRGRRRLRGRAGRRGGP